MRRNQFCVKAISLTVNILFTTSCIMFTSIRAYADEVVPMNGASSFQPTFNDDHAANVFSNLQLKNDLLREFTRHFSNGEYMNVLEEENRKNRVDSSVDKFSQDHAKQYEIIFHKKGKDASGQFTYITGEIKFKNASKDRFFFEHHVQGKRTRFEIQSKTMKAKLKITGTKRGDHISGFIKDFIKNKHESISGFRQEGVFEDVYKRIMGPTGPLMNWTQGMLRDELEVSRPENEDVDAVKVLGDFFKNYVFPDKLNFDTRFTDTDRRDENNSDHHSNRLDDSLLDPDFDIFDSIEDLSDRVVELDRRLNLFYPGSDYYDWAGLGEKWIVGYHFDMNAYVWYLISQEGHLYKWHGNGTGAENFTKLAELDRIYYEDTSKIYDAIPDNGRTVLLNEPELADLSTIESAEGRAVELDRHFNLIFPGDDYHNWGGRNEKWVITPENKWFFITEEGEFYFWMGGALENSIKITDLDNSYYLDTSKIYNAYSSEGNRDNAGSENNNGENESVTDGLPDFNAIESIEDRALALDREFLLRYPGSDHLNWGGWNEKWVISADRKWFFITEDGEFYYWQGGDLSQSVKIAVLDESYYEDTSKIYLAFDPPEIHTPRDEAVDYDQFDAISSLASRALELDRILKLKNVGNDRLDWSASGQNEKWMTDGRDWYFILEDGSFYLWNGGALEEGTRITQFDESYYADTRKIYDAFDRTLVDDSADTALLELAKNLDDRLELGYERTEIMNWGGLNEKWITSTSGWYFMTSDGSFYQWRGGVFSNHTKLAVLDPSFYEHPSKLYHAQDSSSQ